MIHHILLQIILSFLTSRHSYFIEINKASKIHIYTIIYSQMNIATEECLKHDNALKFYFYTATKRKHYVYWNTFTYTYSTSTYTYTSMKCTLLQTYKVYYSLTDGCLLMCARLYNSCIQAAHQPTPTHQSTLYFITNR